MFNYEQKNFELVKDEHFIDSIFSHIELLSEFV